ncbi:MAG TPA: hypothetical protein VMU82_16815 [Acetobacteraceae bacterium]|nr:hypothetical protein [Acetobacteraceae bacterium]
MSIFLVENLTRNQIPLAYPLVREVLPALEPRQWTRLARRLTDPHRASQAGILVVRRRAQPFPCGLVCYRREHDLIHHAMLTAEYFIALDVLDPLPALSALVVELEGIANRLGCRAIRCILQGSALDLAPPLLAAGHQRGGSLLLKVFDRQTAPAAVSIFDG